MFKSITLKFTECDPLVIPAEGVTIFVGPNNSGKSLVLKELETLTAKEEAPATKLVSDFEIAWSSEEQFTRDLEKLTAIAPTETPLEQVYLSRFLPNGKLQAQPMNRDSLRGQFRERQKRWFACYFLRFFQIQLDGRTRFDLTNDRESGDLVGFPQNTLARLFQDEPLRKEIREIIHDAFGLYFVIDPLNGGKLRIRLSQTPPTDDEQSLGPKAREFHGKALHIKEASDGVQAFVGILTAVRTGDYRSILIDEPEAFLHPPLARKLGYELARGIAKRGGSLMASTHSPDFLIGCLQASPTVRVVRLEYSNGKSKGRIVDSGNLTKYFKTPLVRSANVISALFHDGVVVTESDNDRAFYSEIYFRLAEQEKGAPSLLFVNAQNKQTIKDIIGPLRTFGVPAAAISDIDILKDGGQTWTGWLTAAGVPATLHGGLGVIRGDLHKAYTDAGIDMKSAGGVEALPTSERGAANSLFDTLAQYGVFVTRKGELEHWLKHLGVPGKKTDWTVGMLERMGADPSAQSYVRPATDDVWAFMGNILTWIRNSARLGT